MSRVMKEKVDIKSLSAYSIKDNLITVVGALGTHEVPIPDFLTIHLDEEEKKISLSLKEDTSNIKNALPMNGTMIRLLKNAVTGVTTGFEKVFIFKGLGYKHIIENNGRLLNMHLGYSHPVYLQIPNTIEATSLKPDRLKLKSINNQLLGDFAHKLKVLRKWNPYKQKGVMEENELQKVKEVVKDKK